jgi:transglutaminase-like putative cysteine protease
MRLQIRYSTEFAYGKPVRESHNQLRACPATTARQSVESYEVFTSPPGRILTYRDYWGTRVDEFGIRVPHSRLLVTAESTVVTGDQPAPEGDGTPVSDYRTDEVTLGHFEFLQPSPHARGAQPLAAVAQNAVAGARTGVAAVTAVHDAVRAHMEYAPGATYVGMDVNEVFAAGKGVCQDFAHLAIAMYRGVGIPARYVSGYLYAADQSVGTAPDEAEVEIQTHAWVEAFVPRWGWWALDPTNPQPVGERHVKIGHGRDYDDVLPLRGVYHGTEEHELAVRVQMSRERLSQMQVQQ